MPVPTPSELRNRTLILDMLVKKHVRSGTINEIAEHAMSEFVDVFKLERAKHPELLPVFEEPRFYTVYADKVLETKNRGHFTEEHQEGLRKALDQWELKHPTPPMVLQTGPHGKLRAVPDTRARTHAPPGGLVERGNIKIAGGGVRRPRESPGPARPRKKKDAAAAQPPATSVAPEAPSNPTTSKGPPPTLKVAAATQAQSKPTTSKAPATKLKVPLATEPEAPVRPTTSAAPATKGKLPPATKAAKPPAMEAAMTAPIGPAIPHPKGNKHHGIRPPTDEMSRLSVGNIPQSPPRLKALDDMDTEDDSARPPITEEEADELPDKGGEGGKSAKRKRKATPKDAGDHPPKKQKNEEESDTDDDSNVKPQQVDGLWVPPCLTCARQQLPCVAREGRGHACQGCNSSKTTCFKSEKQKEKANARKREQAKKHRLEQKATAESTKKPTSTVATKAPKKKSKEAHAPAKSEQKTDDAAKAPVQQKLQSKSIDANQAVVQAKPQSTVQSITIVHTGKAGDGDEPLPHSKPADADPALVQGSPTPLAFKLERPAMTMSSSLMADGVSPADDRTEAHEENKADYNKDATENEDADDEEELDNEMEVDNVQAAGPQHRLIKTVYGKPSTGDTGCGRQHPRIWYDDETGIPRYPVKIEEASDIEVPKVSKQKKGKSKATADDEEPDVEDEGFEFVDMDGPVTMQEYLSHLKNCRTVSKNWDRLASTSVTRPTMRLPNSGPAGSKTRRTVPNFTHLRRQMESKHLAEITSLTERVAGLEQALKITTAAPPTDLGAALATTMYNTFQESGFADDDMDGTTYFPAQPTDHSEFRRPNTFLLSKRWSPPTMVSRRRRPLPPMPWNCSPMLVPPTRRAHCPKTLAHGVDTCDSGDISARRFSHNRGYTIQARRLSPNRGDTIHAQRLSPTEVTPSTAGAPVQDDSLPTELTPATADAPDADDSAMTQVEPPTDNNGMDVDPQTSHWTARDTAAAGWEHSVPEAWGQQRSVDTLGPPEPPLVLLTPPTPQNSQETNAPVTELFVPTPATSSGALPARFNNHHLSTDFASRTIACVAFKVSDRL
ncbi:hypothetical protein BJ912DRAFT_936592 [Pholiota molesta]|nr:hypothetical protein BJ912DRAFT_936592 [Pholiota molesta]